MIRNKAITQERVTAEEWRKANETSHIVFPNRDSEWNAVLERAVHNDYMYGALDASRAAGRIDQEYINPRDRKSTPWGDQQWNMKKVASEAAHIPLGMRQDIQAKYHHGRAPPGDWADMPDRDDYMVRGVVSDPNRRAYDCLRAPGVRATLLNAQTGQCIPLDDPTWVPEIASSHLLVGTITTIASHVDCALGRAWRMPMFHPQLMAATAMLEKLQKYFNALNEAVLGKRLGTAPFSMIAGHLAPELRTIPTTEQMSDTLAQSAAEIMLSHVSALSHSGSTSDRKEIIGRDGHPFGKSWFEDDPEGATWPGHHMAGGVAVPLKPKTKIVWGKRPHMSDEGEVDPEAGVGSGKVDDVTLPDIGKLSVTEQKKDDMDVDQEGSKKDSTGTKEPTPRATEAGKVDPSEITNFKGAAPDYEYSGEGDDRRILPKNTPIDMEKSLPAEVALLIPSSGHAEGG